MTFLALLLLVAAPESVQYVPARTVAAAMKQNPPSPLVNTERYAVMAFQRTGPGESELHDKDSDVFYVVEGKATFVTGGKITGGKVTAPGETRGSGIEGGQAHQLAQGDVITIPAGTPHWFKKVEGTFRYFIVKSR